MLAAFKVKMNGSEMKKTNRNTSKKFFVSTTTDFLHRTCCLEVSRCNNTAKKCTKRCTVTCKLVFFFLLIGPLNFFVVLVAVAVEHSTRFYF